MKTSPCLFLVLVSFGTASCGGCGGSGRGLPDGEVDTVEETDGGTDTAVETIEDVQEEDVVADEVEDVIADPGEDECEAGEGLCLDHVTRRYCDDSGPARIWREETCAEGWGCVLGECVEGECSDACNLGDTDVTRTCELFDVVTGSWIEPDPSGKLHDRSRAYNMWLRRDGMAHGGVGGNAIYSDPPTYDHVVALGHIRDSAIWTGTYLAAEAMRLQQTGSADARRNVERLVETLHLWFNVSGHPGLLARFVAPAGAHPLVAMDCTKLGVHCDVEHDGVLYDYWGHISRDQYQGVMLGYAAAYEALGDLGEEHRALIREDVVELVDELMLERDVRVRVTVDGVPLPAFDIHLRYVVLDPTQMLYGAITFMLDTSNLGDADMVGFQEFTPNLAHIIRQVPFLGGTPDIPRSSSAIMLSSFFRVGMLVTDGVPGYEARHDAYVDYYYDHTGEGGNVDDWLGIARTWSYTSACGEAYYGNNISMQPMYNWARLEDDFDTSFDIRYNVLEGRMWPTFVNTKNSFFSFIYAGTVLTHAPEVVDVAVAQLAQFPPPPRVKLAVDLRTDTRYMPHEDGCDDQVHHGTAVDVGERCASDFIWQSKPWELLCPGDPYTTFPGVDYLVAYWMGRHHDFIEDDTPGHCLAWR
jgi:hypothetical protein